MADKFKGRKGAKHDIKQLFAEAHHDRDNNKRASAFVKKAYMLALKTRTKIPQELKKRFCKYCFTYFIHGKNYRVRTTGKTITYTCFTCGQWARIGYKE